METLLVEPFGGMAGDMFLAAALDLGDPRFRLDDLRAFCRALIPGECALDASEVRRQGLRGLHLDVRTADSHAVPHEHEHHHDEGHDHGHAHGHHRDHAHAHPAALAAPPERRLADLLAIAERAPLAPAGKERARRILRRLAEAEARAHGLPLERVHFHELGAVDTLVDVCGACFALERLEIERVVATPPLVGAGTMRCAHGELPVPPPGTAEILRSLPHRLGASGERLTPTGAALLAELVDSFEPAGEFRARAVGYGAGTRDPADGPANLVRLQIGQAGSALARREAWLLEVNLDDATGEEIGFLLERLREAGALEAWSAPIHMKKDRPGAVASALCRAEARARLESAVFEHSPSLGLRWTRVERAECERETVEVELGGARVRVVVRNRPGGGESSALDLSPEHDDLASLARASGRPLRELEREAVELARALLGARARPA